MTAATRPCSTENWTPVTDSPNMGNPGGQRKRFKVELTSSQHRNPLHRPIVRALWHRTCHIGLRDFEEGWHKGEELEVKGYPASIKH